MLCGKCGAEVGEDFKFCPECGTPMPVVRKAAEKALDKGKETVEKVRSEVEDKVAEAKDQVADAAESVKDKAAEVKDQVADAAENVKDTVAEKAEDVKAALEDESEKVKQDVKEIEENAKRAVKEETERVKEETMENPVKQKESIEIAEEEAKKKAKIKNFLWCMAVLACAVIITVMAQQNSKVEVALNDYVAIAFDGYDTEGTAKAVFDKKAFVKAYEGQVEDISGLVNDCIDGKLSQTSGLSNGDEVTYTWACDDETAANDYKAVLNYSDLTVEVADLEELPDTTGMIFPDSATERLSKATDLADLDMDELRSALNEIYARHGYIFHNEKYQKEFEQYSWYEPTIDADDWDADKELNNIEKYNVELLKAAIKELKEEQAA